MTDTNEIRRYADTIITLIKEDQDAGQVPRGVCSWVELDDSVDTEDYYRQAQLPSATREANDLRNAVNDEVSRRLAASQGGPWGVTWTSPDGRARDIGRAIGYAPGRGGSRWPGIPEQARRGVSGSRQLMGSVARPDLLRRLCCGLPR